VRRKRLLDIELGERHASCSTTPTMISRGVCLLFALLLGASSSWALPPLVILEPDGAWPNEYAADVRGDPWDMLEPTDITLTADIGSPEWQNGVFSGVSQGNDAWFHLAVPPGLPVQAARYRMMTLRIQVSQATSCWLYWSNSTNPYQWHNCGPFQLSPGWNTVSADLSQMAAGEWAGDLQVFRIDPCVSGGIWFAIDEVTLSSADHGDGSFVVRWDDGNHPSATLSLYFDEDNAGFDGTIIAAGIPASDTGDSLTWDMSGLASGAYYVYGDLTDGVSHSLDYSPYPVWRNVPPSMTLLTPDDTRVAEGEDYTTTVWVDALDMAEDRDIDRVHNVEGDTLVSGTWWAISSTNDPALVLINAPIIGLDLHVRGHRPIDTQRYTQLSFRMYLSEQGTPSHMFQVLWYDSVQAPSGQTTFFPSYQGWHTYSLDLTTVQLLPPFTAQWQSEPREGLRLDPTSAQGDTMALDWVRLTYTGDLATRLKIEWYAYDPDNQATIDLYYEPVGWGDAEAIVTGLVEGDGYGAYLWDTSFLPPGTYEVFAEISDPFQTVVVDAPGPLLINHAPLLEFTAPSRVGQDDYAGTEFGDPWDMNQATDVAGVHHIAWWTVENGILTGETNNLDSWVEFRLQGKIPAETYHRLTYRLWLEGPQDIGVGSVTKAYYQRAEPGGPVTSGGADCILEEDWRIYTYDLAAIPLGPEIADTVGWADSISMFRLDIHEFTYPRIFHLDYAGICTDHWADTSFTIRWWDSDPDDNATISLYADVDSAGFDGNLIASGIPENGLGDYFRWGISGMPGGARYIYAIVDDGLNVLRRYALAPLRIDHPPVLVLTEPNGFGDELPSPEDYAADVRGDPWDLGQPSDFQVVQGIADTSYAGGIFSGTISGAAADLRLAVPAGQPISAANYGILSMRMSLSAPAAMHLFWKVGGSWNNNTRQLAVYDGWRTYRVDIDSVVSQGSWAGQVQGLQISIYFATGADLGMDWVTLTRDGAFADTIRWVDADAESDAKLWLYYDTDAAGYDGDVIASGLSENSLVDSYLWDCSFLPPGQYYIHAAIDDGFNPRQSLYSSAPFVIGDVLLQPNLSIMRYGPASVKPP
jgi:hypothetical protein